MKKVFLVLVLVAALLASRWLLKPGYFIMHDDLQMMRQLQMEKCFTDGQFPCRWVPDMGYGYGYPLFNFYPPLPYYVGQVFRWVGFPFTTTVNLTFALQFFLSGAAMFVLASSLWGPWGGLLSSVFYIWAPYHAVDIYIRGAMNEGWAFVWFPLIFWASKELISKEKWKYVCWLALGWGSLLLTHNIMVFIFAPFFLAWLLYWLAVERKLNFKKKDLWLKLTTSGLWALGLAAFFTIPLLFEKKFTQIESMFSGYFDWHIHFATINQLFISRFWGYGPSTWGVEDKMPFPVGHLHWILSLIVALITIFSLFEKFVLKRKIKLKPQIWLLIGLFGFGLFYVFLAHQRSTFIWERVRLLQLAQFPWRLLVGAAFAFSLLVGSIWQLVKNKVVIILLVLGVIVLNWSYFKPESMGPLPDEQKFSGIAWENQQSAALGDYLPKTVQITPKAPPEFEYRFITGKGETKKFEKGTNWLTWRGEVEEKGTFEVSVIYFPGWSAWVDGKEVEVDHDQELGTMIVSLDPGEHLVEFRFTNTPVRSWSNLISLLSWWSLLGFILFPKLWRLLIKK